MNSAQIDSILRRHFLTRRAYQGCYAADEIAGQMEKVKEHARFPCAFVVNTDERSLPGEHWIAFFIINSTSLEYFDSLAAEPPDEDLIPFLKCFKNVKACNRAIQNPFSNACGQFCIYFLINRCNNKPFEKILKFLFRLRNADAYVKNFVANLF